MQSGKGSTRQQEGEGASAGLGASGPPPPPTSAPPLVGASTANEDGPSSSGNGTSPAGGEEGSSSWPSWLSKSDVETVAIAVAISYAIRLVRLGVLQQVVGQCADSVPAVRWLQGMLPDQLHSSAGWHSCAAVPLAAGTLRCS